MKLIDFLIEPKTKHTLYIAIGASGTGKSTLLKNLRVDNPDIESFSFDDLRHEWYDKNDYGNAFKLSTADKEFNKKAHAEFKKMIKAGGDIFVDNTNLTKERRKFYLDLAKKYNYHTIGFNMPIDVETIVARQKTRGDKNVKESAVRDQFARLQPGTADEFDELQVINPTKE
jgi:predicted kinase